MSLSGLRAEASHVSECPEIGPICALRPEPPQEHHTTLWLADLRAYAEYGLLDWLAVQAILPLRLADTRTLYTDLTGRAVTLDYENIHHRDETQVGLGDAQLLGHVAWAFGRLDVGARLGVSLPLGVVHENPYRLGELGLPHEHLQFGTGSFDPVASLDLSVRGGPLTFSFFGWTQVPLYAGRNGYQAGTRLVSGLTLSAPLGDATVRAVVLGLNEWAERWDGQVPLEDGNQGRTDLYLGFGLTVPFAEDWAASIDLRARAWGVAKNAQLDLPVVLEVSLGRLFHLEGEEHHDEEHHDDSAEAAPAGWKVIDTWASWCRACRVLETKLQARPDLEVERVQLEDPPFALPHVQLVDPQGRVVYEASGTPEELMRGIDAAMNR